MAFYSSVAVGVRILWLLPETTRNFDDSKRNQLLILDKQVLAEIKKLSLYTHGEIKSHRHDSANRDYILTLGCNLLWHNLFRIVETRAMEGDETFSCRIRQ